MIKKNLKTLIITSIITLLPILAGLYLWDKLPAQMPVHFDSNGEPDGFASKEFAVFGLPAILVALQWFMVAYMEQDPKKKNMSDKMITLSIWIVPLVSLLGNGVTYLYLSYESVNIITIATLFLGALLLVIGNYIPKMKQTYTIGIKLPWTLNSEENWYRTHRFAGVVFMLAGIAVLVAGFTEQIWLVLAIIFVAAIIPSVYSFVLYKKGI